MKAKELRLKNLVTIDNPKHHPKMEGIVLEVTAINPTISSDGEDTHSIGLKYINQKKNTYYENFSQFVKFLSPIPLTIDILEKNGLNKGIDVENGMLFGGFIRIEYNSLTNTFETYITGENGRSLEYVHELQNWWYWTTGEELTLKL